MSNYPDNFNGTNMDYRDDTESQDMLDHMFRTRKEPISIGDTLFACFKSSNPLEQIAALNKLGEGK